MPLEDIGRWYPDSYYGRENVRFNPGFEVLTRLFRRRRARFLSGRAARGPVLDVGCGRGIMLDALRRLTGQDFGYDIRAWHAWYFRQQAPARNGTQPPPPTAIPSSTPPPPPTPDR